MFLSGLLNRGSLPVLEQVVSFTQARQEVLADNISNFDTVGYKARDLDVEGFNAAIQEAVERRDSRGAGEALRIRSSRTLAWDKGGRLKAEPILVEDNNILFHDKNNRFVEKQMSEPWSLGEYRMFGFHSVIGFEN